MKKIICYFFAGCILLSLSACFTAEGELRGRTTTRLDFNIADPYGMVELPGGSFTMGANDQDVPYANRTDMKTITISPFWIDQTEITNAEYRQFTHWVRDSIIRKWLMVNTERWYEKWGWTNDPDPSWNQEFLAEDEQQDRRNEENTYINWYKNLNFQKREVTEAMVRSLILPEDEQMWLEADGDQNWGDAASTTLRPHFQSKLIDRRKLIYDYTWFDANLAASRVNTYDTESGVYYEGINRNQAFIIKERVPVYPDTLTWVRDFTYNFNEPMFDNYFWHPAYNDYPVVGVSWKQAKAFCHWRTEWKLYHLPEERRVFETPYRLPTEAEWEWAARGGRELAMFPWGGPYSRNYKGCFMANFKPLRGNYWADGYIYTAPADAYGPNDYYLFNMAGNVAEWTESAFNPMADIFASDLNPEYTYNAQSADHPHFKKKVIKGGSWKDIGAFLQIGARDYEYQDSSRCYIGFRCVKSNPFEADKQQYEERFKGVKKNMKKNKKNGTRGRE